MPQSDYEQQQALVAEVWSTPPTVKSLWQSKIYYETTMRLLTRGTAPHFMHYIKQTYFTDRPAEFALSIGSGWGDLDRTGYEVGLFRRCLGFDLSEGAVQRARTLALQLGHPLAYEVADLNRLSLQGRYGPFDLIFANASLHHIQELERLFEQVEAVLAPDGLFFFHEYVGPSRFQWRPKTLAICTRILDILPKRLRGHVDQIHRPTFAQFVNGDPSEAVHSEEIISIASMFFDLIEVVDGGTTLTQPLLNDIIRYFDEDAETEATILRLIFLLEEILIQEHVLESDTKLVVFRKRRA
jgi:O-antigen biosynthesis protein